MTCYIVKHFIHVKTNCTWYPNMLKSSTCLQRKSQFTEIFPFEAYRKSEKLELTKENEYDFRNQHPQNYLKTVYLADPKNCMDPTTSIIIDVIGSIHNRTSVLTKRFGNIRKLFAVSVPRCSHLRLNLFCQVKLSFKFSYADSLTF